MSDQIDRQPQTIAHPLQAPPFAVRGFSRSGTIFPRHRHAPWMLLMSATVTFAGLNRKSFPSSSWTAAEKNSSLSLRSTGLSSLAAGVTGDAVTDEAEGGLGGAGERAGCGGSDFLGRFSSRSILSLPPGS